MVMALVLWFVRPSGQKIILSVLMVFSIAAQIWMVNVYRNDWRTQLDYYWQLYWRAPALQPGTAIFSLEQPSLFVTHHSDAGFALNTLYHYKTEDGSLPTWFFSRRDDFDYQPNDPFQFDFRGLWFKGNTSDGIAILHQLPNSCLRVLDNIYTFDPLIYDGHEILMPVSNPARIIADPQAPPPTRISSALSLLITGVITSRKAISPARRRTGIQPSTSTGRRSKTASNRGLAPNTSPLLRPMLKPGTGRRRPS